MREDHATTDAWAATKAAGNRVGSTETSNWVVQKRERTTGALKAPSNNRECLGPGTDEGMYPVNSYDLLGVSGIGKG